MSIATREQLRPASRVPFLVAGVAVFAFIDMELLTRHLLELFVLPLGFTQLVVRPALALAALVCLIALYVEGAAPRREIDDANRRSAALALVVCIMAFVIAYLVTTTFAPESQTTRWGDETSGGSATYPVLDTWRKVAMFVPWIFAAIGVLVLPVAAMITPPYIMRFGRNAIGWGLVKTMWRHRQAYGWRTVLLLPISLIAWPARDFWMAGLRHSDGTTSSRNMWELAKVLEWNKWFGPDRIALSAGVAAALLGLLLWWIGNSVGRALDTGQQTQTTIDMQIGD